MIVYLANKTRFREDILSNRIEFNIPQTGKRVDFIVTGTRGDGQSPEGAGNDPAIPKSSMQRRPNP